jgi:hypothetical protein
MKAIASGYINAIWVKSHENFADMCTKALGSVAFNAIIHHLMEIALFLLVCG